MNHFNSTESHCFAVASGTLYPPLIPPKSGGNFIPLLDKEGLGVVEQLLFQVM
jgi:hypothetical protein